MRVHVFFDEETEKGAACANFWESLPKRARSAKITEILYAYLNGEIEEKPKERKEKRTSKQPKEEKPAQKPAKQPKAKTEEKQAKAQNAEDDIAGMARDILLEGLSKF